MERIVIRKINIDSCLYCPVYNDRGFMCPDFPENIWEHDDPESLMEEWFSKCKRWERLKNDRPI